jgi:glutamyl-Q tRNA(Asp) synthetase
MEKPATRVFRFAPSPNGYLHLGHALSAILNFEMAMACGGRFLLRIEDIDSTRARRHYETAIEEDLAWLGLVWEKPARRQSQHLEDYQKALDDLRRRRLVYPCFCSRGEVARKVAALEAETGKRWPRDPDGTPLYPRTCHSLSSDAARERAAHGDKAAWRLDLGRALEGLATPLTFAEFGDSNTGADLLANPALWGDALIARRDIGVSYHLAVCHDDALQGVTDIVRGRDLFAATHLHRLIQHLMHWPVPVYRHHRLILDSAGEKLAKSRRAPALRDLRAAGITPEDIRRRLGLHLAPA